MGRTSPKYPCTMYYRCLIFFASKLFSNQLLFTRMLKRDDGDLRALYNISLLIAKLGKPHTIEKQLIVLAIKTAMFGRYKFSKPFKTKCVWIIYNSLRYSSTTFSCKKSKWQIASISSTHHRCNK